ncbi:MAG: site-specific DNA-methyltransferase [Rhodobacteraceae bacterium]|nr:site-specific DNA-methyltransferase [Paracoccaceae bacterium]
MLQAVTIGAATLICGDVLTSLDGVGPVDAVITDPPYSSGGTHTGDRTQPPSKKYVKSDSANRRLPDFGGDMRDQRSFVLFNTLWASKALDLTREGGVIATFTDWRQLAVTTDYVQAGGWIWRGVAVWAKLSARPQRGRYANSCEYAVWGSKGAMPFERGVPPLPGVFTHGAPRERVHITQKPVGLMEDLVAICAPGGTVLDPFMGSGTTGIAALSSGRKFVGIEKSPELFDAAVERIRHHAEPA